MTYDQLSKEVKKGIIRTAYLFYGPEIYVRDRAINALKEKIAPPGYESLNMTRMEGDVSLNDLSDAAQTMPMMGERRLIILRDWPPLAVKDKSNGKDDEPAEQPEARQKKQDDKEETMLKQWAQSIPDTCCLIIVAGDGLDKRRKFVKTLMECVEPVEFPLLQGTDLHRYCNERIAPKRIDSCALEQLSHAMGPGMTVLASELDKLCAYVGEREEITPADVEAIASRSPEDEVFKMIDHLMTGNMVKAQALLKDMLINGEKPPYIIAMLIRQLRILTHVRLMRDQGITQAEIQQKLNLSNYVVRIAASQAGRYTADALEQSYRACVMADYSFKSGQARDDAALDDLMLRLGQMRRNS